MPNRCTICRHKAFDADMERPVIQKTLRTRNASGPGSARGARQSGTPDFFDRFGRTPPRGLPKYAQLREAIMAAIDSGHWTPGEKLPTETELVRCTPFSLGTVQRALRSLVEEGLITRAQGSGTYVADSRQRMEAPWHCRFLNDDGSGFLPVFPKLVVRKRVKRRGPWSAYIDSRDGDVIQIDRRLGINDEFFVYSRLFMSAPRFGRLLNKSIKEIEGANLKTLIRRDFHLPITHIGQRISMLRFPGDVCRVIKVPAGTPGTLMEGVAMAGTQINVYYQQLYIPPNDKHLVVSDSTTPWLSPAGTAAEINE
jgi:DNA-binding GntR family transcriptional regulator